MDRRFFLGIAAYIVPTFIIGYVWHLVLFKDYYSGLKIYREDILIPFGILSMVIQGALFSLIYSRLFAGRSISDGGLKFGLAAALLSWSYMVIAVAAKHVMTSVSGYLVIESAFVALQFAAAAPLMWLVYRHAK